MKKADNGNRTRLSGLGSQRSTDEPYLQKEHKILYSMFLYFASPNFYYDRVNLLSVGESQKIPCYELAQIVFS